MDHLKDGRARYLDKSSSAPAVCLDVMVERNLVRSGPEGLFQTDQVGITWVARDLPSTPSRGGVFEIGCERFLFEEIAHSDGHMITAACRITE